MARQSELDELRKEVDALRRGQGGMMPLGAEAEATFKSIQDDLNRPLNTPTPAPALTGPDEWPDSPPVLEPLEVEPMPQPKPAPKKAKAAAPKAPAKKTATAAAKPKASRKKAVEL